MIQSSLDQRNATKFIGNLLFVVFNRRHHLRFFHRLPRPVLLPVVPWFCIYADHFDPKTSGFFDFPFLSTPELAMFDNLRHFPEFLELSCVVILPRFPFVIVVWIPDSHTTAIFPK